MVFVVEILTVSCFVLILFTYLSLISFLFLRRVTLNSWSEYSCTSISWVPEGPLLEPRLLS